MGELLRARCRSVYVSLSHEIVREYREYERTSTTVMNAYIGPETQRVRRQHGASACATTASTAGS